jgi:4-hydroxythreonine-4-phosphate dehydrogenase
MKPILISSGEPAGIGPDLCLALAQSDLPVVILADPEVLEERAQILNTQVSFRLYDPQSALKIEPGWLTVLPVPSHASVVPGQLNSLNAAYVLELLTKAATLCQEGFFSAMVTAPVHKAIINKAGISFTGHTEFFAQFYGVETVVMMLACPEMRVALATTHLPLRDVPDAINETLLIEIIHQLHTALRVDFGIRTPRIKVAGLNPHAGESGYLGREEIEVITPAIKTLQQQGLNVEGPFSADTLFNQNDCDAYVAMYHDQGLPVLKYAGFNQAVNITLGLPVIRTSVDHGTALELAGKNIADPGSLMEAVKAAHLMAMNRMSKQ